MVWLGEDRVGLLAVYCSVCLSAGYRLLLLLGMWMNADAADEDEEEASHGGAGCCRYRGSWVSSRVHAGIYNVERC